MSKTITKDKKLLVFSFVTAAATVIAGIIHLQMVPGSISHNLGEGILFLVGGLVQIFWAVPVIKQWGKIWQIIGLVGTGVFILLWLFDRLHLLPEVNVLGGQSPSDHGPREFPSANMTSGEFPRGPRPQMIGLQVGRMLVPPIEIFQIVFIGLYASLAKLAKKR